MLLTVSKRTTIKGNKASTRTFAFVISTTTNKRKRDEDENTVIITAAAKSSKINTNATKMPQFLTEDNNFGTFSQVDGIDFVLKGSDTMAALFYHAVTSVTLWDVVKRYRDYFEGLSKKSDPETVYISQFAKMCRFCKSAETTSTKRITGLPLNYRALIKLEQASNRNQVELANHMQIDTTQNGIDLVVENAIDVINFIGLVGALFMVEQLNTADFDVRMRSKGVQTQYDLFRSYLVDIARG